jgi:hypothetical protein
VLAHMKKCLFCKVTPVSMQTFVEGLLRLVNVLEATSGTLKNVNNICTLAIKSTQYVVLFSGDLTSIQWRVLHVSTTFAAFVSTEVTLAYSCARLRNFCPHQQVSQTVWLFEGNHARLRKNFGQFGNFLTRSALIVTQTTHVTINLSKKLNGSRSLERTSLWNHL